MKPSSISTRHAQLALARRRRRQAALGQLGTCTVCGNTYPTSSTNGWDRVHSRGVCSSTCHERLTALATGRAP